MEQGKVEFKKSDLKPTIPANRKEKKRFNRDRKPSTPVVPSVPKVKKAIKTASPTMPTPKVAPVKPEVEYQEKSSVTINPSHNSLPLSTPVKKTENYAAKDNSVDGFLAIKHDK